MQNFKMEGIGTISGGEYDIVKIEGVGSCKGNIKANEISIEGVFDCNGDVETGLLYCEGVADFKSNIRAKKLVIEGVLSERSGGKIEAEEIVCDGAISTKGEVSADIINAEGCIEANEIVGDRIRINSRFTRGKILTLINRIQSKVKLIEATTIELRGVTAEVVNGNDITIGPKCNINTIDCSGVLFIDKTAKVNKITGNYTTREY